MERIRFARSNGVFRRRIWNVSRREFGLRADGVACVNVWCATPYWRSRFGTMTKRIGLNYEGPIRHRLSVMPRPRKRRRRDEPALYVDADPIVQDHLGDDLAGIVRGYAVSSFAQRISESPRMRWCCIRHPYGHWCQSCPIRWKRRDGPYSEAMARENGTHTFSACPSCWFSCRRCDARMCQVCALDCPELVGCCPRHRRKKPKKDPTLRTTLGVWRRSHIPDPVDVPGEPVASRTRSKRSR